MSDFEFTKRVLFIGVPDMALVGLDTLLHAGVNIVGVIGPLKTHNTYATFKNFVASRKQNFIEYDKLTDNELHEKISDLNVDIAVVCSFNNKIPKSILDIPKDGILNIHPSLLPYYRGGNPYSRVIMNGETKTGVTLHFMSEDFDKGDIVEQKICEVEPYETMGTIFNRTNIIGVNMLLKALIYYEKNNTLPRTPQPEGEFIKAPNIKDNERLIDYNKSAIEIDRLVRGLNPYITALTVFKNDMIKVFKTTVLESENPEGVENGEIYKIEDDKIYIKTSNGCIIPEIVQYAGYITGDCADFIRVAKPQVGDRFTYGYT